MDVAPELIDALREAKRVVVLTGAGISAESGVPTFRDAQTGLWAKYDPHELATPTAFRRDPRLVWEWYSWRRDLIERAVPNSAHLALAQVESLVPDFTLITQNVDGLHRRAGSQNVIELHGNIFRTRCSDEGVLVDQPAPGEWIPPRCPGCGGDLRPDVVWFGESIPEEALLLAFAATDRADIFLSVGTSTVVQPAASLPFIALQRGAVSLEINRTETPFTEASTFILQGQAGSVLPAMIDHTWPDR